jgi:hypothetical protein
MAKQQAKPLKPRDIQGLKYLDRLMPLLDQLHEVGCQRDKAGNRCLHYDQYCVLVLLYLFNPVVRSLRALQQATTLENVQRKLGCSRASLGSLSEAVEVFDPQRLCAIIETLAAELQPVRDVRQAHLRQKLIAVDGSVVKTVKSIAEAAFKKGIEIQALDASAAANASAYELAPIITVKRRRKGKLKQPPTTRLGTPVAVASAIYNASNNQVTLTPRGTLILKPLELIVNAALVTDQFGSEVDGNNDGQTGGNYMAIIRGSRVTAAGLPLARRPD